MKRFRAPKVLWLLVAVLALGLVACATQPTKPMSAKDFVAEAKKHITEISVAEAKAKIESGAPVVVLDVREPKEYKKGHLPKAVNLPRGLLEFKVAKVIPNKNAYIIVYCKSGGRSALAAWTLRKMGYKNAVSMAGGWKAWVKAGYPVE